MVSVSLVQGDSGIVVWSGSFSGPEKDIFSLQERLAQGVGGAHPIGTSGTAPGRDPKSGTHDVDALSKYGQAVGFLERPDIPGNLQRATSLLQSAIERDPNFALAWARLGEAFWATYQETSEPKWASEATSATSKALTLDQNQPEVWISLALIHHGTGRREEALTELNRALKLQANSDDAHRLMGQVLQALGRNEEAEKHYREAVALRPNYWRHYNLLGGFYYATGRTSEAVTSFTRVTELQPDNARGFHNLGTVYYALGDNPNALKFYERALAIEPRGETFSNIGNIHYIEGRYGAAAASFQQAVDALPNDGAAPRQSRRCVDAAESQGKGPAGLRRVGTAGPAGARRQPERRDHAGARRHQGSQAWRADRGGSRHHPCADAQCKRCGSALSCRGRACPQP